VNLFSDYNSIVKFKTHEDMKSKSEREKLLLAIALSGEVAAQTKTHHKIRTLQTMSEGFEST
jgi:hypothetical protein